jgi:signal transduction histidine kinase
VLVVYADDRLLYAAQQVDAGLREVLASEGDGAVEYFGEFMDFARFGEPLALDVFRQYLLDKYRETPPDLVMAVARPALEFLVSYRSTLFPKVPLVHLAVTRAELSPGADGMAVGLVGAWDSTGALDLALRLQPDLTHIAVVGGVSARDRIMAQGIRTAAGRLGDRLRFTWITQHTLDEAKAAVAVLPPKSAVVFVTMFEDTAGQVRFSRDVVEQLARVSSAPIYGPFESYVGYGVVGGTMETWHDTGAEAGRLAIRILRGQSPEQAVAGHALPIRTIVDWRQVERWNLTRADFPVDTEFRFRQPTLWEAYRVPVLVGMAVGVAQLALIAALAAALQRRRAAEVTRREAEARAAGLRDELAHATRVTLLGELAATLAHEINQPLAAILSNAQATRRWLKSDHPDLDEIRAIVDDIIADDKRAGEIIHRMRALLKKGDQSQTRFDLARAIRDVAQLLHGELIAAHVTLDLDVPTGPVWVNGDEVATQQVVLNLMMNAVQSIQDAGSATRRVGVTLSIDARTARVAVHDTGAGISEETRARLFEPFFTTKARGLGVGLAICRRIAEAQGGTLDLDPAPATGATFVLDLPSATRAA